jgi:ADP-ribose pyrophosphatase
MKKWKKVRTIETHDYNGYYRTERDEVVTPSGKLGEYSVVRGSDFSMIIPVDKNGKIYLVKQHRYPIDKIILELPAGGTDGENSLFAAKRELEEESSLISSKWKKIGYFYEANGLAEIKAHVFIAYDVKKTDSPRLDPLDKDVFEVEKYSIEEVREMIVKNLLVDGPSISAFSMALLQGGLKEYEKKE